MEQFSKPDHALISVTGSITADGQPDFAIALETNLYDEWVRHLIPFLGEPKAQDERMWITSAGQLRDFLRQAGQQAGVPA